MSEDWGEDTAPTSVSVILSLCAPFFSGARCLSEVEPQINELMARAFARVSNGVSDISQLAS